MGRSGEGSPGVPDGMVRTASDPGAASMSRRKGGMTAKAKARLLLVASAGLAFLLTACGSGLPQNSLEPAGPTARTIDRLFQPVFWIAAAVFFLVEGLLVVSLIRFRHRPGTPVPVQVHGNRRMEIGWTIAPAVLLAAIAVPTLLTIFSLYRTPTNALTVEITGHQWWWDVKYPSLGVETANEIHIPVGQKILVKVTSYDVIHSFWVPRLAGKQDLEPGKTNHLTIEADAAGTYLGQCAEYCGTSHANMRLRVIADPRADFDTWVAGEQQGAPAPPPDVLAILQDRGCGGCHTINGVEGLQGVIGPDLTHFGSRKTFAGAIFDNTPEELAAWLRNPPGRKPGADMPNLGLSDQEVQALVTYLEGLK
jgi:cytochrome c oxidase subunit 2